RAMSTLARAELRTPRPASMGTTARPRHHSITVIVLLQLDDPLTLPDASAGYFLGSFSLRSDWAARSLTNLIAKPTGWSINNSSGLLAATGPSTPARAGMS